MNPQQIMKQNELRIGCIYRSVKFGTPVILGLLDLMELNYRCDGAVLDEDVIGDMFRPMPLNVSWLYKLGFIRSKDGVYGGFMSPEHDGVRYRFLRRGEKIVFALSEFSHVELDYVHELQILYSILAKKELPIKKDRIWKN
jgi:hypothetical protein